MRYAIFSDVHANLTALERLVADAVEQRVTRYLCLGDVVGYGPQPAEVLARVRDLGATMLAGNHDDAVCGRLDARDFIDLAGDAVIRHRAVLAEGDLMFLRGLPYRARFAEAVAVHGDFTDPKAFNYIEDEASAAANFGAEDRPLAFVGHTHVPCLFLTGGSGRVYRLPPQDFVLEPGKRYIVNPGSVGYPREANGICRSSYVIYDTESKSVCFRFLPFSVSSVMQRGRGKRRLLPWMALGLTTGVVLAASVFAIKRQVARPADSQSRVSVPVHASSVVVTTVVTRASEPTPRTRMEPLAEKSLALTVADAYVRANVRLERDSPPVQLRLAFRPAAGDCLAVEMTTVRSSSRQRFVVPSGAQTAVVSLMSLTTADRPQVAVFEPTVEARTVRKRKNVEKLQIPH